MRQLGICIAVVLAAAPLPADEHHTQFGLCALCGQGYCHPTVEMVKATETCWEVEEREICIPAIRFPFRFPWCRQDCDESRCGRVRRVKVLVEREYEVDEPEWTWHVRSLCPDCEQAEAERLKIAPSRSTDIGDPVP